MDRTLLFRDGLLYHHEAFRTDDRMALDFVSNP
jgi:hypothetical protein